MFFESQLVLCRGKEWGTTHMKIGYWRQHYSCHSGTRKRPLTYGYLSEV